MKQRGRIGPRIVATAAMALGPILIHACDDGAPIDRSETRLRVVTLAPALTQMVADLGHAGALAAVSEHDAAAPRGLPVVGNFVDIDTERLAAVAPTHVLMMTGKSGVPASLASLGERIGFDTVAYRYPASIADIAAILADADRSVGSVLGTPDRARTLAAAMLRFFEKLAQLTADRDQPRVLMVIGTGPIMASGPGTVHDELLRHAGGRNAAEGAAITAPSYDREALLAMDPQVVLVLAHGSGDSGSADRPHLPELDGLSIEAVQHDRVMGVADPLVLLPSTSLPRIAAKMATAIHPQLRDEVAALLTEYESHLAESQHADDASR